VDCARRPWRIQRVNRNWMPFGSILTAAGMLEAANGFRRLKAHKYLPALRAAPTALQVKHATKGKLEEKLQAA